MISEIPNYSVIYSQKTSDCIINKLKQQARDDLEFSKLPENVSISTMTIICEVDTKFLCRNIATYIDLKIDGIQSVTHGVNTDPTTNRTIIFTKKNKKKKKKKKIFYNQVSMYVIVCNKTKPVNVKIFSNGAIQMTGCTTTDSAIDALDKIFTEFQTIKGVVDFETMQIVEKPFVENTKILKLENITKFKIAMINSNFKFPLKIDRIKLYNVLLKDNYESYYEPIKHASVDIKFDHLGKIISIFVFEKGSVIITGAKNCSQILDGYNFINKYLLKYHKQIIKNDCLKNIDIDKYI